MPNKQIQLPTVIKDVTLMSPGIWNGWNYSSEELRKAYELTDWTNHEVTNLFLDHPENSHNAAGAWAGRVINQNQLSDGTVKGDLEIWDEKTIINLTLAKAKFGVSPRVLGSENEQSQTFTDFIFDNFSIVSKPAQSTAAIELNSKELFDGFIVKHLNKDNPKRIEELGEARKKIITIAKELNLDISDLAYSSPSEKKIKKLKGGKKEMSDEEVKNEDVKSEETSNDKVEKSEGEVKEEDKKSEELSDSDVLGIMNDNFEDFNSYANGIRVSNPAISLKELAKGFTDHQKKLSIIEDLSASEATIVLKKLLNKVGGNELSESSAKPKSMELNFAKELSSQIQSLTKQVQELSNRKSPAAKAVRGPSHSDSKPTEKVFFGHETSEGVQEMASLLKQYSR